MAFDLFFGKTRRSWSRSQELTSVPSLPAVAPTPTHLDDALSRAIAANPGIMVEKHGRGAVVSKKWGWG
jgi:hypothetical protein